MGEERKLYKVMVGEPEGKSPLGRPRRGWEDGIRLNLRVIDWQDVDFVHLVQGRGQWRAVVNAGMDLRVLAPRN
jgi:hypothetical protein